MFWYKIFSILLLISHGRVFSGALSSILDFFEFEEFQYTRRSSLLDSAVNRWTRYSSFSSKIDFHRVTEFYWKYSTLKHERIMSNIEFKVTRKSSTRLAIFKSFPDSVLDSTRFDFCRGGVPIGKLAHGCNSCNQRVDIKLVDVESLRHVVTSKCDLLLTSFINLQDSESMV